VTGNQAPRWLRRAAGAFDLGAGLREELLIQLQRLGNTGDATSFDEEVDVKPVPGATAGPHFHGQHRSLIGGDDLNVPRLENRLPVGLLEYRYELLSRVVEPFGTEPSAFTDLSGDGEHVICGMNRAIDVSGGEPSIERKHHDRSANQVDLGLDVASIELV
jgi:hypothetical protein